MLIFFGFLTGCVNWGESDEFPEQVEGYRPIYRSYAEMKQVQTTTPRLIEQAGKIYVFGNYLFINELSKGVHIVDNANPKNPKNLAFIHIPANIDIAVKNNTLYADNGTDMVVFDMSNPLKATLVKRIENAFPNESYPPQRGYFECVDASQGMVVGWELATLKNPKCLR